MSFSPLLPPPTSLFLPVLLSYFPCYVISTSFPLFCLLIFFVWAQLQPVCQPRPVCQPQPVVRPQPIVRPRPRWCFGSGVLVVCYRNFLTFGAGVGLGPIWGCFGAVSRFWGRVGVLGPPLETLKPGVRPRPSLQPRPPHAVAALVACAAPYFNRSPSCTRSPLMELQP
jgi:hypothetical protein